MTKCVSPWFNCTGWLGVKKKRKSYLLTLQCLFWGNRTLKSNPSYYCLQCCSFLCALFCNAVIFCELAGDPSPWWDGLREWHASWAVLSRCSHHRDLWGNEWNSATGHRWQFAEGIFIISVEKIHNTVNVDCLGVLWIYSTHPPPTLPKRNCLEKKKKELTDVQGKKLWCHGWHLEQTKSNGSMHTEESDMVRESGRVQWICWNKVHVHIEESDTTLESVLVQ